MIGPFCCTSRYGRSWGSCREDLTAGELAVDEPWTRKLAQAPLLYFHVADAWVQLARGSLLSATLYSKASSNIPDFELFCDFYISSLVASKNCEINLVMFLKKCSI